MVCNDFYIRNLKGLFFLLFSCLLFSVTGTLQQLAPEGRTPVVIPEVRLVSVLLLPVPFTYRIKYPSPVAASTLALTEPLMAAALGICFLHELMIISMALGIFSLIGSVVVLIFDYP